MRNGQIQIQFNWIFVIIVGGIIIMFFTNVVNKQSDISEMKISSQVISDLETIATGTGVSKGTAQIVNKPDLDLSFRCPDCACFFTMKGNDKNFNDMRIFAPQRIPGRDIIAWTLGFNAPFRVTNYLYLTSPLVRYFFVDDTSTKLPEFVNESLPSFIDKEFSNSDTLDDQNYPIIKMVYLADNTADCPDEGDANQFEDFGIDEEDISAVCIYNVTPFSYDRGTIQFYDVDDWKFVEDGDSMDFIDDSSLFAAIFAHNRDIYSCNVKEAMKRMRTITRIYLNRTDKLTGTDPTCGHLYTNVENELLDLRNITNEIANNASRSYTEFYQIQNRLKQYNTNLHKRSCPSIY